jgi:glycosyltransferase involved in cell wall biosynthesis
MYRKIDAIVSIGESSCFLFVLLKRLLQLRKPVVVVDPALGPGYPRRKQVQDHVLPQVERVIVYATVQREYLQREYGDRVQSVFLHHRVSTEFFDPAKTPDAGSAYTKPSIISVGGDISRDFDTLCRSIDGLGVETAIYTQKPIQAHIPKNVAVHRQWVPYRELRSRYRAARLVVVPMRTVIHPGGINALLEGMAMGKAVIVSDSPGVRDYIEHGRTAWVVPPEDPAALRDAIVYLMNHPEIAAELGRNARQFCELHCAFSVYGDRFKRLLRDLIDQKQFRGITSLNPTKD